jgi:hypothetical protein
MLMSLPEGSRESLRRLSSFTWMAEELLQVTDYFLSSKPVSIVGIELLGVVIGSKFYTIKFKDRVGFGSSSISIYF